MSVSDRLEEMQAKIAAIEAKIKRDALVFARRKKTETLAEIHHTVEELRAATKEIGRQLSAEETNLVQQKDAAIKNELARLEWTRQILETAALEAREKFERQQAKARERAHSLHHAAVEVHEKYREELEWSDAEVRKLYNDAARKVKAEIDDAKRLVAADQKAVHDSAAEIDKAWNDPQAYAKDNLWKLDPQLMKHKMPRIHEPHIEAPLGKMRADYATSWEYVLPHEEPEGVHHDAFAEEVFYFARPRRGTVVPPRMVTVGPEAAQCSEDERTFLYMDVGLWGGSDKHFKNRRDFGVICGRTAAICEFNRKGSPQRLKPSANNAAEVAAINGLLAELGEVQVTRALTARTILSECPAPTDTLYVILGDMHLPVTTVAGGWADPTLHQWGRFDIDDQIARARTGGARDLHEQALVMAQRAYNRNNPKDRVAWELLEAAKPSRKDWIGSHGHFNPYEWYNDYDEKADIFEDAYKDLEVFMQGLTEYERAARASNGAKPRVHMVQIGDMFDLWVGMLCFFLQNDSPNPVCQLDSDWILPTSQEFVDYWSMSTLYKSAAGPAVRACLGFAGEKTFLYGNHDCYFGEGGYTPNSVKAASGFKDRVPWLVKPGHLVAEHGHRVDPFNQPGKRAGWALTQAAFKLPAVRLVEPSRRLQYIMAAGNAWLDHQGEGRPFCHYIMGHTHVPALCKVTIRDVVPK